MTTTPTWSTLSVSWAHWPCYPATLCQLCWWTKLDVWGCWVCHAFINVFLMLYTRFKEYVHILRLYIWWYINYAPPSYTTVLHEYPTTERSLIFVWSFSPSFSSPSISFPTQRDQVSYLVSAVSSCHSAVPSREWSPSYVSSAASA